MMKVGPQMFGRTVVCPQCGGRLEVPFRSDPKAEDLYRFMKQKRAEEKAAISSIDNASGKTPVSESIRQETFEELEPDEVDRWIDEFWATIPENGNSATPNAPVPRKRTERQHSESDGFAGSIEDWAESYKNRSVRLLFRLALAVVFVTGLCAGFVIHAVVRNDGNSVHHTPHGEESSNPIVVRGELFYRGLDGRRIPDADAVVILLPSDRIPGVPISCSGLEPGSGFRDRVIGMTEIEESGGVFCRTGADGTFSSELHREGRYLVLMISAHIERFDSERV